MEPVGSVVLNFSKARRTEAEAINGFAPPKLVVFNEESMYESATGVTTNDESALIVSVDLTDKNNMPITTNKSEIKI